MDVPRQGLIGSAREGMGSKAGGPEPTGAQNRGGVRRQARARGLTSTLAEADLEVGPFNGFMGVCEARE